MPRTNLELKRNHEYEIARTILRRRFIAPEELMQACPKATYSGEQLARFKDTFPQVERLLEQGKTSFLLPGPPISVSLSNLCNQIKNGWQFLEDDKETSAVNCTTGPSWIAIYKSCTELLEQPPQRPNLAEVVWAARIFRFLRGGLLLHRICVSTSNLSLERNRILCGNSPKGDIVAFHWKEEKYKTISLFSPP